MSPTTPPRKPAAKNRSLADRAEAAVSKAYRKHGNKYPSQNPIFTDEMFDLLREQNCHADDPLCLYRYYAMVADAEWYVMGAERLGKDARNIQTGESAEGKIQFWAFARIGDPDDAEIGVVPLDKGSDMGLRDLRHPLGPAVAAVELDKYYEPERLSVIVKRIRGRS